MKPGNYSESLSSRVIDARIGALAITKALPFLLVIPTSAHAQKEVTVTEFRVVDSQKKGVKSYIFERTRKKEALSIAQTDDAGILKKSFKCAPWHTVYAKPLAGPYTQSEYEPCDKKPMILELSNVKNYPQNSVRLIVPASAGGTSDLIARVLAPEWSARWQQTVAIENKPGAAGNVGAAIVADAAPTGYTILLAPSQLFTVNPSIYTKLPYDPIKDFTPVTTVVAVPDVLVVASSLPARSVQEMLVLAKARPGQIRFASSGQGTTSHLAGELLKDLSGTSLQHVPYKGAVPAFTSLSSGQADAGFVSGTATLSQLQSKGLRVLAVAGATRSALFPNVPTIAEAGVGGYELNSWYGVFIPSGTPQEILDKLSTEIRRTLDVPDIRQKLLAGGTEPLAISSEQFASQIRSDTIKWSKVLREAGVRPQ